VKICWIHPTTRNDQLESLWRKLDETVRPALRSDTELEFRFLTKSTNFTRSLYAEHLNSVFMVEAALKAREDGFDGVFLGCWNDPLWEAREVLDVPVASVGEQSMLAALAMGKRFAVVTVSQKTVSAIENDLAAYGLAGRAIGRPVRSIAPDSDAGLLLGARKSPRAASATAPRSSLSAAPTTVRCSAPPAMTRCREPACRLSIRAPSR
jgi:allantoin racemase